MNEIVNVSVLCRMFLPENWLDYSEEGGEEVAHQGSPGAVDPGPWYHLLHHALLKDKYFLNIYHLSHSIYN